MAVFLREPSRRVVRRLLFGLIALHFLIVSLFVFSVIPQEFHPADRPFWFHNGGDNESYFELAASLLLWEPVPSKYPVGFPISLLPFIAVLKPATQDDLLQPVAAFWSLVMFPLAQLALYRLAAILIRSRIAGLLTVLFWTALPLAMWLGLRIVANPQVAETNSVHLIWAQMLSDGPATLLTILGFLCYMELRRQTDAPARAALAGVLGLTLGALLLVRYTGALSVAAILVLLLLERRWMSVLIAGLLTAGAGTIQLYYNLVFFGNPFTTGYTAMDRLPERGLFDVTYLTAALSHLAARSPIALAGAIAAVVAALAGGLWAVWRISRWSTLVLVLWILPYMAFYGIYFYSWDGGLLRFLMPAYPAFCILGAALVAEIAARLRRDSTPAMV